MEWITVPEKGFTLREVRTLTNRNVNLSEELEKSVSAILEKVRDGGDAAIRELTKKFDGVELSDFRVTEEEMQEALAQVTPEFLEVLKEAKANIETFHKEQVRKSWTKNFREGVELGEQFLPIQRVGVYVPGGREKTHQIPVATVEEAWQLAQKQLEGEGKTDYAINIIPHGSAVVPYLKESD